MLGRGEGWRWRRWAGSWLGAAGLILLGVLVYGPGVAMLPPVDRDECRFAQASRQMFEAHAWPAERLEASRHGGGWAVPYLGDRPRLNKPPLVYWLQVLSAWGWTGGEPGRDAVWMYRVPSAVSAVVTVLATWWFGKRWFDARAAWLGGGLLAVAPMVAWDAAQARADQLMVACTTVAMGALGVVAVRAWRGAPEGPEARAARSAWVWAVVFWVAVAGGVMAKGFVTPMVAGLAVAAVSVVGGRWRWVMALRPGLGMVVLAGAVGPWLYFVAEQQGGLGAFLAQAWREFFVRGAAGSAEGHFAPPGTHLVLLAGLLWPGSLLTLAGLVQAWRRGRGSVAASAGAARARWLTRWRGRGVEVFLLAWAAPMWVVFELSMAKLPHYTMPLYPAVALLSARMVLRMAARRERMPMAGVVIWAGLGVALVGALAAGLVVAGRGGAGEAVPGWAWGLVVVGAAALAWAVIAAWRGAYGVATLRALVVSVVAGGGLMGVVLPGWVPGAGSAGLAAGLAAADPGFTRPIGSTFFEESVRFASRGRVVPVAEADAWAWVMADRSRVLIVPVSVVPAERGPEWRMAGRGRDKQGRELTVVWRE